MDEIRVATLAPKVQAILGTIRPELGRLTPVEGAGLVVVLFGSVLASAPDTQEREAAMLCILGLSLSLSEFATEREDGL